MYCDTQDEYCHKDYSFSPFLSKGPPLVKKTSRLIIAVVRHQVAIFKHLLDSPKWYNVCDNKGYNLLQIAIIHISKQVFDYLLSIPEFPLEYVNHDGQTAFALSLNLSLEGRGSEHFAYELIKKGACINKICKYNLAPIHCAIAVSYSRVSELLIESGVDVNVRDCKGRTPLDIAFLRPRKNFEEIFALLAHGAVPTVDLFEKSVLEDMDNILQENLLLFLCDEYTTSLELDIMVLLELIQLKSVLIKEIIKYPIKIKIEDGYSFFTLLCSMRVDDLELTLEKYNDWVRQAFSMTFNFNTCWSFRKLQLIRLENLDLLLGSNLKRQVMEYIVRSDDLMDPTNNWGRKYSDHCCFTSNKLCCYLLSYDLITLRSVDLSLFYLWSPREFFKFCLYMDVKLQPEKYHQLNIMSILCSDVTTNFDTFLHNPSYHTKDNVRQLVKYFAHPKLKEICRSMYSSDKIKDLRGLPTLVEIARNSFREYFIKRFKITTCKQFYYLLDCLLINPLYKKIITYETELYTCNCVNRK